MYRDFLGMKTAYDESNVVILPVAYDRNSSWKRGSRKGPHAILSASAQMEEYDIETNCALPQLGIFTDRVVRTYRSEKILVRRTREIVKKHLMRGKYVVTIGGSHTVSIGPILAHGRVYDDMTVLHLDAHADLRDIYMGSRYNHACVMNVVREEGYKIIHVGIRSMAEEESGKIDRGMTVFCWEIDENESWMERVIPACTGNTYVTIDLDVLDPGIMPSTGTPEPGGMSWKNVLNLIKKLSVITSIVGFDVVELVPNRYNSAPDYLAAKLIDKILCYKYATASSSNRCR